MLNPAQSPATRAMHGRRDSAPLLPSRPGNLNSTLKRAAAPLTPRIAKTRPRSVQAHSEERSRAMRMMQQAVGQSTQDKNAAPRQRWEAREEELQDRSKVLKNFWYAAALSEKLTDKPKAVEMLGRVLVLWRDKQGVPHVADDACPHRGARLSSGWVTPNVRGHDCVVCPYHGWAFDASGRVQDVPSVNPDKGQTWPGGVSMITFVNTVPISESRSINRFCLIRNFALSPVFDGFARRAMHKILCEDKVVVDQLGPEAVRQELSVAADRPQIAFRKLRQEFLNLGYGVPMDLKEQRRMGL